MDSAPPPKFGLFLIHYSHKINYLIKFRNLANKLNNGTINQGRSQNFGSVGHQTKFPVRSQEFRF